MIKAETLATLSDSNLRAKATTLTTEAEKVKCQNKDTIATRMYEPMFRKNTSQQNEQGKHQEKYTPKDTNAVAFKIANMRVY